jgi:DNA-binding protein HU-beta
MTQSRMDRDRLVEQVVKRTGNSAKTVEKIVDAALEEIYAALKRGESVSLRNFGTFYVRPERSTWVFRFNPSQRLRKLLGWSSTYKGDV